MGAGDVVAGTALEVQLLMMPRYKALTRMRLSRG